MPQIRYHSNYMQFVTISLQGDEWENRRVQIYVYETWIQFQIKVTAMYPSLIVVLWVFQHGKVSNPCINCTSSQSALFPTWKSVQSMHMIITQALCKLKWSNMQYGWVTLSRFKYSSKEGWRQGENTKCTLLLTLRNLSSSILVTRCSRAKNVS